MTDVIPVAPQFEKLLQDMEKEKPPGQSHRAGALFPVLIPLAELVYLGYPLTFAHEFVTRAGIKITYSSMCTFIRKHIGTQTGEGSEAHRLVQTAVNRGAFNSSFIKALPPGDPISHEKLSLPASHTHAKKPRKGEGADPPISHEKLPAPPSTALLPIDAGQVQRSANAPESEITTFGTTLKTTVKSTQGGNPSAAHVIAQRNKAQKLALLDAQLGEIADNNMGTVAERALARIEERRSEPRDG